MRRHPICWQLLAFLLPLASGQYPPASRPPYQSAVDCGGHYAATCGDCPAGNKWAWCNGDCVWLAGADTCMPRPSGIGAPVVVVQQVESQVITVVQNPSRLGHLLDFLQSWGLPTITPFAVLTLIFACAYKNQVVDVLPDRIKVREDDANWIYEERPLFECLSDGSTCLYTTLCLPLVVAKNFKAGKVCGFWPTCIFVYIGLASPFYCLTAIALAFFSNTLKRNLQYERNLLKDMLLTVCCLPCVIGRQSVEVDLELMVQVGCVNKVTSTETIKEDVERTCFTGNRTCARTCGPH